jgi:hypothetical protein
LLIKKNIVSFFCSYGLPGVDFVLDISTGKKQNKYLLRQFNLPLSVPHVFWVEIEEHWEKEPIDR